MTPQRAAILRLLDGNKRHPSAEDIYARIKRKFSGMSFATVYNTLQSLLSAGKLAEVRIDSKRSRFDPGLKPHSHLMCVHCGAILDLPLSRPPLPAGKPAGFRVLRCNVEFYGVCRDCGRKPAAGAKRRTICATEKKK
ncbi:MAG: hypothetical protein A2X31_05550 [Elusimicrobia bacterium GWB2_63_22]|nr:MAG: hypothetical protein A2X31_05550 [Elusimicrobia bacterium GWB2_63_22]